MHIMVSWLNACIWFCNFTKIIFMQDYKISLLNIYIPIVVALYEA